MMDSEARFNSWKRGFDKLEDDNAAGDSSLEVKKTNGGTTVQGDTNIKYEPVSEDEDQPIAESSRPSNANSGDETLAKTVGAADPAAFKEPLEPRKSRKRDGDDVTSALGNAMEMMEDSRRELKEGQLLYHDGELRQLFKPVFEESISILKAAAKNSREYPKAKELLNKWYKSLYESACFNNIQNQTTAEAIEGLCDDRFGSLADKLEYSWTKSCKSPENILTKFMMDCPLELEFIKGYGKPWEDYYRKCKLAKAKKVFQCVDHVRQYEFQLNNFLDKNFCIDIKELDQKAADILATLEVPTEARQSKLKAIIGDLDRRSAKIVTKNLTAEKANVQRAVEYASNKYQELMTAKTSDFIDPVELQRLHEETLAKTVKAFSSVPGFEYSPIWHWPEKQPEQVDKFYAQLRESNEAKSLKQVRTILSKMDTEEKRRFLRDQCPELLKNSDTTDDETVPTVGGNCSRIKIKKEVKLEAVPPATPDPSEDQPKTGDADEIQILKETLRPNESKHQISIHFSTSQTLVSLTSRESKGIPVRQEVGLYPGFMTLIETQHGDDILTWRSKKGFRIFPSDLISDHALVATDGRKFRKKIQNEDFYSEELLAMILTKIKQDIEQEFGIDPLDTSVAVTIPAMAHPACRQRLKTALHLVNWKNSVIVQMSTAIALSCRKRGPAPGYQALTMFFRAGLIEFAVFQVSRDHVKMIAVRTSTALPKITAQVIPEIASEAASLTRRMLQGANIPVSQIYACFVVAETNAKSIQRIVDLLKEKLGTGTSMKWVKKPPNGGIIPGLSDLSLEAFPRQLYSEVFPWRLEVDYGIGRNRHLVHVFDEAVSRGTQVPVSSITNSLNVYHVDFERKNKTPCISINAKGISNRWPKPSVMVQVSSEGMVTLDPEFEDCPSASLSNFNMPANDRRLNWAQQRLSRVKVVQSKFQRNMIPKASSSRRFSPRPSDQQEPDAKRRKKEQFPTSELDPGAR